MLKIYSFPKENFINDDCFQRFCQLSLGPLKKHVPCMKKHAQGNQMPFFNKELVKQYWHKLNYKTFSYKIGLRKIEYVIQNKEIFVSLFYKKQKKDTKKI